MLHLNQFLIWKREIKYLAIRENVEQTKLSSEFHHTTFKELSPEGIRVLSEMTELVLVVTPEIWRMNII